MNQGQLQVIDYLREENRVLREQLGGRRLCLDDNQRRRLAIKAKALGGKVLAEVANIVTPETLLAWHRKLIAQKYDGAAHRSPGRPRTPARSRLWWFAWQKRIGTGATDESRAHYPTWATILPAVRSRRSWNGTESSRRR